MRPENTSRSLHLQNHTVAEQFLSWTMVLVKNPKLLQINIQYWIFCPGCFRHRTRMFLKVSVERQAFPGNISPGIEANLSPEFTKWSY